VTLNVTVLWLEILFSIVEVASSRLGPESLASLTLFIDFNSPSHLP